MHPQIVQRIIEQCRDSLVIVPTLPSCLVDLNPYSSCILGHRDTVLMLLEHKFTGLLVRGDKVDQGLEKIRSNACLYIPSSNLSRIFLVKSVSHISKDSENPVVDNIFSDIKEQIVSLDTDLNSTWSQQTGEKFCLNIVLHTNKLNVCKVLKKRSDTWSKFGSVSLKYLEVKDVSVCNGNNTVSLLKKTIETNQRSAVPNLLQCLLQKSVVDELVLRKGTIKGPCGSDVDITNRKNVVDAFDVYFHQKDFRLQLVPDVDRILDNLLHCTDDQGHLLPLDKTGCYQGEVEFFIIDFLKQLEEPSGLLLKNFNQTYLESLVRFNKDQRIQFEVDWLYCGNDTIVAFEVGMTEWPMNPISTVRNKLNQSITKLLPVLQYLVFSLIKAGQSSDAEPNIVDVLSDKLFLVILFPNISGRVLQMTFRTLKEKGDLFRIESISKSLASIIMIACNENGSLEQFEINSSIELERTRFNLSELTRNAKSESDVNGDAIKYVSGLFSLSVLFSDTNWKQLAQHVDLHGKFSQTCSSKSTEGDPESYFLTPEQLRILDEDRRYVMVQGEPGTGKTFLLLEKLKRLVKEEETELVIFVYNLTQHAFASFIRKCLQAPCFDEHRSKIRLHGVSAGSILGFNIGGFPSWIHKLLDSIGSLQHNLENVAILYDEAYDPHFAYALGYAGKEGIPKLRCLWICRVVDGAEKEKVVSDFFHLENLHVLLRSAKHINELAQKLIYFSRKRIDDTSAFVLSVFISSQTSIPWEYFSTVEQFQQKLDLLDSQWENNRMFITVGRKEGIGEQIMELVGCKSELSFILNKGPKYATWEFGGCEASSVVVIVLDASFLTGATMTSAVSRGQFEAAVFLLEDLENSKKVQEIVQGIDDNGSLEVYRDIANGRAIKTQQFDALSIDEKCETAETVKQFVGKRRQLSLKRSSNRVQLQFSLCYSRLNFIHAMNNGSEKFCKDPDDEINIESIKNLTASAIEEQKLLGQEDFAKLDLVAFSCIAGNLELLDWAINLAKENGSLGSELKRLHQSSRGCVPIVLLLRVSNKSFVSYIFELNTPNYWKCFKRIIQAGFPTELLSMIPTRANRSVAEIMLSKFRYAINVINPSEPHYVLEILGSSLEYLYPSIDKDEFIGRRLKHKIAGDPGDSLLIRACLTGKANYVQLIVNFLHYFFYDGLSNEMNATYKGNQTVMDIFLDTESASLECVRILFEGGFKKVFLGKDFRLVKGPIRLIMRAFENFHVEIFHFLLLSEVSTYLGQHEDRVKQCEYAIQNSQWEHWFNFYLDTPVDMQMLTLKNSKGISFLDLLQGTYPVLACPNVDLFDIVINRCHPGNLYEACKLGDLHLLENTLRSYGVNPDPLCFPLNLPDNYQKEITGVYSGNNSLLTVLFSSGKATKDHLRLLTGNNLTIQDKQLKRPVKVDAQIFPNAFEVAKHYCNRDLIKFLVFDPFSVNRSRFSELLIRETEKLHPEWFETTAVGDQTNYGEETEVSCKACNLILGDFGLSGDPGVTIIDHSIEWHTKHKENRLKEERWLNHIPSNYPRAHMNFPVTTFL